MLVSASHCQPDSKCFVTQGSLPPYVDQKQPPTSKKPFSIILNQTFTHTVTSSFAIVRLRC